MGSMSKKLFQSHIVQSIAIILEEINSHPLIFESVSFITLRLQFSNLQSIKQHERKSVSLKSQDINVHSSNSAFLIVSA
jgi:hypothetical protein